MPTHGNATDTRELQPATVEPKAVAILFQTKAIESRPMGTRPFEARVAGRLAGLHPPKERLKCFVEIGNDDLQMWLWMPAA